MAAPEPLTGLAVPLKELYFHGHQELVADGRGAPIFHRLSATTFCTSSDLPCAFCGAYVTWELRSGGGMGAVEPCPHPRGFAHTIELAVPSGRIVFGANLFPAEEQPAFDELASAVSRHRLGLRAAALGIAYGYARDAIPTLYQHEATSALAVASLLASPSEDGDKDYDVPPPPQGWRALGVVSGSMYSYCVADAEAYARSGGAFDSFEMETASVKPGIYTFTALGDTLPWKDAWEEAVLFGAATHRPLWATSLAAKSCGRDSAGEQS